MSGWRTLTLISVLLLAHPCQPAVAASSGRTEEPRSSQSGSSGESPLWTAVYRQNVDLVKRLLAEGADLEAKVGNGWTPLFVAAYLGNAELVRLLMEHGAAADGVDGRGMTALMLATVEGRAEAVEALLAGGAIPDVATADGRTALQMAAGAGNTDISRRLIRHRADLNHADRSGLTPLSDAVRAGSSETVDLLVGSGAGVEISDVYFGRTPLHWAAILGYPDIAERLLDGGASLEATDNSGSRALDLAARYGNVDVALLLEARGSKGPIPDPDRCGPSLGADLGPKEAVLWYLGHSGWAVKTRNRMLIFDYWNNGRPPTAPGLCNGRIRPEEVGSEHVDVFVTHEHTDHFDPVILEWRERIPGLTYIFGFEPGCDLPHEVMGPRAEGTVDGMKVTTIESNDAGVGFAVEVDGLTILHLGDHANRTMDFSEPFREEIDRLAAAGVKPDIALLPIVACGPGDAEAVELGVHYVLKTLKPRAFLPMHCGGSEHLGCEFVKECAGAFPGTAMAAPENRGDRFRYRGGAIERL